MRDFLREELSGWKKWEVAWLLTACFIILVLSVYWHDTPMGIVSAITGAACVVCTGKGKLSAYVFGAVNTLLYAIISYQAKYYGEVMLNLLYYFPLQFYGFYVWKKNINTETHEVKKKSMEHKKTIGMIVGILAATAVYGIILQMMGGALSYVDAFSTVVSIAAMIISIKMYAEQWLLWIIVDIVTVFMWAMAFIRENDSIATLVMWIVYLSNAVIMYIKWKREASGRYEL